MSYGPPPLPRDASHADRLYWAANPPKRKPGELTVHEAAKALGVTANTVRSRVARGKLSAERRHGQLFLKATELADVKLAEELRR